MITTMLHRKVIVKEKVNGSLTATPTNMSNAGPATVPSSSLPSPGRVSQATSSNSQTSVLQPVTAITEVAADSSSLQPLSFSSDASTLNPAKAKTTQQHVDPTSGPLSEGNTVFFKYSPKIAAVRLLVFDYPTVIRTTVPVSNVLSEKQHEPDQDNTSEVITNVFKE